MTQDKVISDHAVRIYRLFSLQPKRWFTNADLSREASIDARTARQYTRRWTDTDLLREAPVFPGYRYQWKGNAAPKLRAAEKALKAYDSGLDALKAARTTGDITNALNETLRGLASGAVSARDADRISRAADKRLRATEKDLRKGVRKDGDTSEDHRSGTEES
jgi:hypothetical protein